MLPCKKANEKLLRKNSNGRKSKERSRWNKRRRHVKKRISARHSKKPNSGS